MFGNNKKYQRENKFVKDANIVILLRTAIHIRTYNMQNLKTLSFIEHVL